MDNLTISTGKAAKMCGVTPDTVLKWIKKGMILALRTPGGHYRIKEESLAPYITEQVEPARKIYDRPGGKTSYCWEFHAQNRDIRSGCRKCMVFKAKAERCYLLAGVGIDAGYKGINCAESCDKCPYFQYINKSIYNVLIITDNEELKQAISSEISSNYSLNFSCCGYDTATVIQEFHPDYIIIDDTIDKTKTEEITKYLINDPRAHGAQIILAVDSEKAKKHPQSGICALIDLPFNAQDIENCFHGLRLKLLGLES